MYNYFMEFGIGENGRPQGTSVVMVDGKEVVRHYTCNAPDEEILKRKGIKTKGKEYNILDREVVDMPMKLFKKLGIKPGTLEAENILARMK